MRYKSIYTLLTESKIVKAIFVLFLFVFLSHYIYQTLDVFLSDINQDVIVNTGDFDSEEENNEKEKELEEIDDYLVSASFLSLDNFLNSTSLNRLFKIPLMPFVEVDLPPPLL